MAFNTPMKYIKPVKISNTAYLIEHTIGNPSKAMVLNVKGNIVEIVQNDKIYFLFVKKGSTLLKEGDLVNLLFENREMESIGTCMNEEKKRQRIEATILFTLEKSESELKKKDNTIFEHLKNLLTDLADPNYIIGEPRAKKHKESLEFIHEKIVKQIMKDLIEMIDEITKDQKSQKKGKINEAGNIQSVKLSDINRKNILRLLRSFREFLIRIRRNIDVWLNMPKDLRKKIILNYSHLNKVHDEYQKGKIDLSRILKSSPYYNLREKKTVKVYGIKHEKEDIPILKSDEQMMKFEIKSISKILRLLFSKVSLNLLKSLKMVDKYDPSYKMINKEKPPTFSDLIISKVTEEKETDLIDFTINVIKEREKLLESLQDVMDVKDLKKLDLLIEKILTEFQKLSLKVPKLMWKKMANEYFNKLKNTILRKIEGPKMEVNDVKIKILRFFSRIDEEMKKMVENEKMKRQMCELGNTNKKIGRFKDTDSMRSSNMNDGKLESIDTLTSKVVNNLGIPWFKSVFFNIENERIRMDILKDPKGLSMNFRIFFDIHSKNFGEVFIDMIIFNKTINMFIYSERNSEFIECNMDRLIEFVKDENYGIRRILVSELKDSELIHREREKAVLLEPIGGKREWKA